MRIQDAHGSILIRDAPPLHPVTGRSPGSQAIAENRLVPEEGILHAGPARKRPTYERGTGFCTSDGPATSYPDCVPPAVPGARRTTGPSGAGRNNRAPMPLNTDKLPSYPAAHRTVMSSVVHCTDRYADNRGEVSHQPTRQRERQMRRFKSPAQLQRFASVHGIVQNLFRVGRHLMRAANHRLLRHRRGGLCLLTDSGAGLDRAKDRPHLDQVDNAAR